MNYYSSVEQLIGKTPLLKLSNIQKELNLYANIFAKICKIITKVLQKAFASQVYEQHLLDDEPIHHL